MAQRFKHLFLDKSAAAANFTGKKGGPRTEPPSRVRQTHAQSLENKFGSAWKKAEAISSHHRAVSLPSRRGTYLEFEGSPGYDLNTKSLEDKRRGIRLLNVRKLASPDEPEMQLERATVFIPKGRESYFLKKIQAYKTEETKKGNFKNAALVESINDIKLALVESFWQDPFDQIPSDKLEWCEVWLRGDNEDVEDAFRKLAGQLGFLIQDEAIKFPERTVVIADLNRDLLGELIESSDDIAEFRLAKETASFFVNLTNPEQLDWVQDLRSRIVVPENSNVSVTVLDTGINNGHLLLEPLLDDADMHTINADWQKTDHDGHGTLMAGVAAFGDVWRALESRGMIRINHRLVSSKILPPRGANPKRLYGAYTSRGVSLAEIEKPDWQHIICMAITAIDGRDQGRPSSWSAAVDKLSSGYEDEQKRLFIISAGNVKGQENWQNYPLSNLTDPVHDPGQSWNALTVGAYTDKVQLSDKNMADYQPIAPAGGLSPYSSTSLSWEQRARKWPVKPDIVLEGGNVAIAPDGFCSTHDDLCSLSLSHQLQRRQFDAFNATSAAAAQAAWMAAQIQSVYPNAWPETVRALLVHSAEWTDAMKRQFLGSESKREYADLLRICGYGVPNLERALSCANNQLTLITQEEIQPFEKNSMHEMHMHELPWPKEELLNLGEVSVRLRITLSYFIEPGPGEVGWKDRYRYASHAFRFELNNVNETPEQFAVRINMAAREEGQTPTTKSGSDRWLIGSNGRDQGSIHSDIWEGSAIDLAECNLIGVYPVVGWWRERVWLNRWDRKARYSLIVSIETPSIDVDIYTKIATEIEVTPVTIEV